MRRHTFADLTKCELQHYTEILVKQCSKNFILLMAEDNRAGDQSKHWLQSRTPSQATSEVAQPYTSLILLSIQDEFKPTLLYVGSVIPGPRTQACSLVRWHILCARVLKLGGECFPGWRQFELLSVCI